MFKKYDANVLAVIIIVSLIMFLWVSKFNKSKIVKDLGDYDYSVGTIEVYFRRGPIGYNMRYSSITYSYIVNGIKYVNNYDAMHYKLPYSPDVYDKFVVAYNKIDPQKSLLLGDYPIVTDDDFKAFLDAHRGGEIKF